MRITKESKTGAGGSITESVLEAVNVYAKRPLTAEEIFTFDILLCDNDIDRDSECFSTASLYGLRDLFVGKTGILDHEWSAGNQVARIFAAEVVTDKSKGTISGEPYTFLKASAYILRTEGNADLIAAIEGGIMREVSVGCSMKKSVCSICGADMGGGKCSHIKGRQYGGRTCYAILDEPADAYEWSFVAVPAQKNAGIMKKYKKERADMTLSEHVAQLGDDALIDELKHMQHMAALGDNYLKSLREEVVRLGVMAKSGLDSKTLESAAGKMDETELLGFKKAFEQKIDEYFSPMCQLTGTDEKIVSFSGEEFMI